MAGRRDLTFTRGETWAHAIKFTDEDGDPLDQSAALFESHVRRRFSTDLLADFSMSLSGGGSILTILIQPPDTELAPGVYRWDLRRTSNGVLEVLLAGKLTVVGDITHA